jgi:hypothetical protein
MVKSKLAFFQMKIKSVFVQASKSHKPGLCKGPKTFNPVNVGMPVYKFVIAVLNTKMLLIAEVYKAIITTPAVRVNNALKFNVASDDALESDF